MLKLNQNKKGFVLAELLVGILILGILAAIAIAVYVGFIEKSKATADQYTLGILNGSTRVYYVGDPSPNPFEVASSTDEALMQTLVNEGYFTQIPVPKQEEASFIWSFEGKTWLLSGIGEDTIYILNNNEVVLKKNYWKNTIEKYTGTATEIVIPKTLTIDSKDVIIEEIYQNAFMDKNLTEVTFASDSKINRIHKWAFKNNSLTEISLLPNVTQIDREAFVGNKITRVSIGANVKLEPNVFLGNDLFKNVYEAGGMSAGTYVYKDGAWIKE
jgi:prepilin-type N-terminal cleavage/methylation domain-containing protein